MIPVGVPGQPAVQYDLNVSAWLEMFFPVTMNSDSDYHPPGISTTSPIVPVDKEVTLVHPANGKEVLWLGVDIRPRALTQP